MAILDEVGYVPARVVGAVDVTGHEAISLTSCQKHMVAFELPSSRHERSGFGNVGLVNLAVLCTFAVRERSSRPSASSSSAWVRITMASFQAWQS